MTLGMARFKSLWSSPILDTPLKDFLVFICPIFIALVGWTQFKIYDDFTDLFPVLVVMIFFFDNGHVVLTAIPLSRDKNLRQRVLNRALIKPIAILAIFIFSTVFSLQIGQTLLAVYGFWHIVSQQRAWLLRSYRRSSTDLKDFTPPREYKIDQTVFWILALVPFAYFATGNLDLPRSYFEDNDLLLFKSFPGLPNPGLALTAVFAIYIGFLATRSTIRFGKIIFFSSLFIWTVVGLLFLQSQVFFIAYLVASHGIGYSLFIFDGWNSTDQKHRLSKVETLATIAFMLVFGGTWVYLYALAERLPPKICFVLRYLPLVIHYAADTVIWRRPKSQTVPAKESHSLAH